MKNDGQHISDESLDFQLRQIDVPDDLKANLLNISEPSFESTRSVDRSNSFSRRSRAFAFAWSSVAVVAFVGLFFAVKASNKIDDSSRETALAVAELAEPTGTSELNPESDLKAELTEFSEQLNRSHELLLKLEIAQLESEIAELRRASITNVSDSLSDFEKRSIAAAVSEETFHLLGGSDESTLSRLQKVQANFPGTQGAELAKDYISEMKDRNDEPKSNL